MIAYPEHFHFAEKRNHMSLGLKSIFIAAVFLSLNAYANNEQLELTLYQSCEESMGAGKSWENIEQLLGKEQASTLKTQTCSCAVAKLSDQAQLFMSINKTATQKKQEALLRDQIINECVERAVGSIFAAP